MSLNDGSVAETRHVQAHSVLDMVAQQGLTLQEGSNTDSRPMQTAPVVSAMAAAAGPHDPDAMANYPMGASGAAIFALPVSPAKDEIPDAKMTAGSSRRRVDHSHTPLRSQSEWVTCWLGQARCRLRRPSATRASWLSLGRRHQSRPSSGAVP